MPRLFSAAFFLRSEDETDRAGIPKKQAIQRCSIFSVAQYSVLLKGITLAKLVLVELEQSPDPTATTTPPPPHPPRSEFAASRNGTRKHCRRA